MTTTPTSAREVVLCAFDAETEDLYLAELAALRDGTC